LKYALTRTFAFLVILLVLTAGAWAGGKPETGEKITPAEAFEAVDSGSAILVDVRDDFSYTQAHIAGAIHVPLSEVSARANELGRIGKTIITYCSCPAEQSSLAAAVDLATAGVTDVKVLLGGIGAWYEAGYPLTEGPRP